MSIPGQHETFEMPPLLTGGVLIGVFLLLLAGERVLPLRRRTYRLLPRLVVNMVLSLMAFGAGSLVVRNTALALMDWGSERSFGLLAWMGLPPMGRLVLGFLLMDLTFYYWHRLNHTVGILWRFHNVHHIDPDLDVTSSFRFHLVEVLYSTLFRAVQVGLLGINLQTYLIYEIVFQGCTMFHHSNLRLPILMEKIINMIIVTPRMHGIHHSQVQAETNSNYSVIFRWWDRLHRTLRLNVPQAEVTIGVAGYTLPEDHTLGRVLTMPFQKQKEYWRRPDGSVPQQAGKESHETEQVKPRTTLLS